MEIVARIAGWFDLIIFATMKIFEFLVIFTILTTINSVIISDLSPVYTTFVVHYPESKLKGDLYIRGDNCNLTWTKGVKINHTATN